MPKPDFGQLASGREVDPVGYHLVRPVKVHTGVVMGLYPLMPNIVRVRCDMCNGQGGIGEAHDVDIRIS